MSEEIRRDRWQIYFNEFSKRNQFRPTRLQIFSEMGVREEERFLPLNGISVEETGHDAPQIEIMLGGSSPNDECHLTHTIARAKPPSRVLGEIPFEVRQQHSCFRHRCAGCARIPEKGGFSTQRGLR